MDFLFNVDLKKQAKARAQRMDEHFLLDLSNQRIAERIGDVKRNFSTGLQIGGVNSDLSKTLLAEGKITDRITIIEYMAQPETNDKIKYINTIDYLDALASIPDNSIDCIFSSLCLHSENEPQRIIHEINRVLKSQGCFIATVFGFGTLALLSDVISEVEHPEHYRVYPYGNVSSYGNFMQGAFFEGPIVDTDVLKIAYDDVKSMIHDLRAMGETNSLNTRRPMTKELWQKIEQAYKHHAVKEKDFFGKEKVIVNFYLYYLTAWKY